LTDENILAAFTRSSGETSWREKILPLAKTAFLKYNKKMEIKSQSITWSQRPERERDRHKKTMPNDFLFEGEESTETDHIQTSIPLALLNLQYTSVKVIMPPSSLIKKSKEKFSVVSLVSWLSLYASQVARQAGGYPDFCSVDWLL